MRLGQAGQLWTSFLLFCFIFSVFFFLLSCSRTHIISFPLKVQEAQLPLREQGVSLCIHLIIMLSRAFGLLGHPEPYSSRWAYVLLLMCFSFFSSPRDLRAPWADRRETLPRYRTRYRIKPR